jgi:hypothetical protein
VKSFKSYNYPLFALGSDEQWLELLDRHFENGIEIVDVLGGSRSDGMRSKVFLGYYLTPMGMRRAPCVVKLGAADALRREYEGWRNFARCQPNRNAFAAMSPPEEEDVRAALVTDFVGFAEAPPMPLADVMADGQPVLSEAVTRLLRGALTPLHDALRSPSGTVPGFSITQGEALANWLDPGLLNRIKDVLTGDLSDLPGWETEVRDPDLLLKFPNRIPGLLEGNDLPMADMPALFPAGGVHGDPNFANVFIAYLGSPPTITGISLIDFEWCKCGLEYSPFDDLARIECELLFSQTARCAKDLAMVISLSDLWLRSNPVPAGHNFNPDIVEAIHAVRQRAAELVKALAPTDEEAVQRAYAVTLLGQAARYISYEGVDTETKATALFLCQLLSDRLSRELSEHMPLPFSGRPKLVLRGSAASEIGEDAYLLRAKQRGSYASIALPHIIPAGGFDLRCEIKLEEKNEEGWLALGVGVQPERPEASGLSASLRWTNGNSARTRIHSHENSRHASASEEFDLSPICSGTLELRLTRRGGIVSLALCDGSAIVSSVEVTVPVYMYTGPVALSAFGADLQVFSLRSSSLATE